MTDADAAGLSAVFAAGFAAGAEVRLAAGLVLTLTVRLAGVRSTH